MFIETTDFYDFNFTFWGFFFNIAGSVIIFIVKSKDDNNVFKLIFFFIAFVLNAQWHISSFVFFAYKNIIEWKSSNKTI